jgi:hypothetical protein
VGVISVVPRTIGNGAIVCLLEVAVFGEGVRYSSVLGLDKPLVNWIIESLEGVISPSRNLE